MHRDALAHLFTDKPFGKADFDRAPRFTER
jgi:hypothetical protein